jgi:hypothetical protein
MSLSNFHEMNNFVYRDISHSNSGDEPEVLADYEEDDSVDTRAIGAAISTPWVCILDDWQSRSRSALKMRTSRTLFDG